MTVQRRAANPPSKVTQPAWFNPVRGSRCFLSVMMMLEPFKHAVERFPAKWTPVRVKKTRQNKKIERDRDLIQNERALDERLTAEALRSVYEHCRIMLQATHGLARKASRPRPPSVPACRVSHDSRSPPGYRQDGDSRREIA